jgi:coenzyme F420 hydrogenase subunit beta
MKSTLKNNVSSIIKNDLCTGCGVCKPLCPNSAIKMVRTSAGFFTPIVTEKACVNCGICLEVCPGHGYSTDNQSQDSAGNFNPLIGRYLSCQVGYSTNPQVRHKASSGGVITSLLIYLLRHKIIDGAVVVTMDKKNPLHAKAFIATRETEVLEATGSKYTPVSMDEVVGQIMDRQGGKFAFVGLPCHLKALDNACRISGKLDGLVVLRIGLYCNNTPSVEATKYVLSKLKIPEDKVLSISYRGNGWPGNLTLKLKNNVEIQVPTTEYFISGFGQYFCRKRCIFCADQTAETADISFADPWTIYPWTLRGKPNQKSGSSVILTRTLLGYNLLNQVQKENIIILNKIDTKKAIQLATTLKKANKFSGNFKFFMGLKSLPVGYEYPASLSVNTVQWLFAYRFNSILAKSSKTWLLLRLSVACFAKVTGFISSAKQFSKNIL